MNGPAVSVSTYRPSTFVDLEDTVAWWSSLSVVGALLIVAGVLAGAGFGGAVAVSGIALFFATAVAAGAERAELATALGVAGVVWTATGISVALGTDRSPSGVLAGLGITGVALLAIGIRGILRAPDRPMDARGSEPISTAAE